MGRRRAEHSGRCVGEPPSRVRWWVTGATGSAGNRGRGAPGSVSGRTIPKGMSAPQRADALVRAWVEGTPRELRAPTWRHGGVRPETGTRPRGRRAWDFGSAIERRGGREPGDRPPAGLEKSFEGERDARGNVAAPAKAGTSAGNRANPMTGCGVQQTRDAVCGGSRRSREERQGRNMFGCGNPEPRETEGGRTR